MVLKIINATEIKAGNAIIIQGASCVVKKIDISKSGKHGASKCRIEAIGIIDDKKRIIAVPGHERFEVPMIEKRKGQLLSKTGENFSLMDSESFETMEMPAVAEVRAELNEGDQVEYWIIEGEKIIKKEF